MRMYVHLHCRLDHTGRSSLVVMQNKEVETLRNENFVSSTCRTLHCTAYIHLLRTHPTSYVQNLQLKLPLLPISLQSKFQFKFSQTIHPALTQGKGNYGCQEQGILVLR